MLDWFDTIFRRRSRAEEASNPQDEKRDQAELKAKRLLESLLSDYQQFVYKRFGYIPVDVEGTEFRIYPWHSFNVVTANTRYDTATFYCLQLRGNGIIFDQMAAQLLLLEANPTHFFNRANRQFSYARGYEGMSL